jgi:TolB-like protein/class 3 adenylate cyclase/Flp pilus assembly protein TadD
MQDDSSGTAPVENRRLAAIMFTDIVGFSRQMGADEGRMLRLLDIHNRIIQQAVAVHHGTVIKTIGDAFLVDFPSVVHAVQCAQQIQSQLRTHNADKGPTEQIHVRIGIHSGDIVQRNGDVFGDGVNIASRLQSLAEPDTVCISDMVYRDVVKKLDLGTVVSLGKPKLKNVAERFAVYALLPLPPAGLKQRLQMQRLKLSHRLRPVHMIAAGFVLLAVVIVAVRYFSVPTPSTQSPTPNPQPLSLPDKPSIVVLPFDNMSKDPEQDYFSNGITEVLTSDLSRISSLFVIARNTAFTYKGKAVNMQDIRKELGVRYVLEGSVQKAGEQVRIVAQLIDTTTGSHLWSERYDRPLKDIFALQDEIVQKIVTTLKLQLTLTEQGYIIHKTTDNLEAYDAYLRGLASFSPRTKEENLHARQMFEQAIALDPQFARAYAALGFTYYTEWFLHWSPDPQTLERAFERAQQALIRDNSLAAAHSLLGYVYAQKKQYDQALAEAEQATALDPNNAISYVSRAEVLLITGRPEEALRSVEQAMRLNPRYPPHYLAALGPAYLFLGRYTEAISTLRSLLARNPNWPTAYPMLSVSYVQQWGSQQSQDPHTLTQAVEAAQRAVTLNNSYWAAHSALGLSYLFQRQHDQAIAELEQTIAVDASWAEGYASLAMALGFAGKSDEAVRMAEEALRRQPSVVDLHLAPVGTAYYLAGKPAEAIAPLKQYLSRYPNILNAHLTLAAVYSELGKETEAKAEATEVLRLNPKFSLEVHKERALIKDPATLERHIAALRKAGLK